MAKKFMFVCLGILALAGTSGAVPVDAHSASGVAAQWAEATAFGFHQVVLCTNGEICEIYYNEYSGTSPHGSWTCGFSILPVPLADIVDWTPARQNLLATITTRSGQLWIGNREVSTYPGYEPVPCAGSVPNQQNSLGGVKSLFR
jgi:hypothetical protein